MKQWKFLGGEHITPSRLFLAMDTKSIAIHKYRTSEQIHILIGYSNTIDG